MRSLTFALFVILLSLLLFLAVHQEIERVRTGYRMGRLLSQREQVRLRIMACRADVAALRAPERLERLNAELGLGLAPRPAAELMLSADRGAD